MKKFLVLLTVVFSVVAFSSFAFAGVQAGNTELAVFGSFQSIDIETVDDPVDITTIQLQVGHFFTDNLQLGLSLLGMATDDGINETTVTAIDVNAKYHFILQDPTKVPYLGLQIGDITYDDGTNDESVFSYGAMAGMKFFLSESTSFNLELNYRIFEFEDYAADTVEVTATTILFGVSYYFGQTAEAAAE